MILSYRLDNNVQLGISDLIVLNWVLPSWVFQGWFYYVMVTLTHVISSNVTWEYDAYCFYTCYITGRWCDDDVSFVEGHLIFIDINCVQSYYISHCHKYSTCVIKHKESCYGFTRGVVCCNMMLTLYGITC